MTRRALVRVLGAAVAVLVFVPGAASAQSAISGVVRDTSGAVLPGVTVEAVSPALIEKTRTVITDNQGVYRIIDLRPGVYTVIFTLPGFSTVRREGLELPDAFTATINADLRVGSLEETITVSGQAPVVDVQNVTQTSVLAGRVMDTLPSNRFIHAYVTMLPGVTGANLGVSNDTRKFWIHGGREVDAIIAIDGFSQNMVPAFSNNSSFYVNTAMAQETTVVTAGQTAEQQFGGIWTNVIPKEGSNAISGYLYGHYAGEDMGWNNLDDALRAKGLTEVNRTKSIYAVEPAAGGPIVRNRLWFFLAGRHWIADRWRTTLYDTDPLDWVYTPDLNRSPHHNKIQEDDYSLRLTWQATPKNKIMLFFDQQPHFFHQRSSGSTNPVLAPEATTFASYWPNAVYNVTWKAPVSGRLFLDAGANVYHTGFDFMPQRDPGYLVDPFSIIPVRETTQNIGFRAPGGTAGGSAWQNAVDISYTGRASASYVTGSHAFKAGWQWRYGKKGLNSYDSQDLSFTLTNGVPRSLRQEVKPRATDPRGVDGGVFVQDQWTMGRATLNYGLRWDYLTEWIPAQELPAGIWIPARSFPEIKNVPNYDDLSPRFGVSYDLFGDGKTALKGGVNRYVVNQLTGIASANDPVLLSVNNVTRVWNDANRDFVPNCDLASPLANGECLQVNDLNFGKPNPRNLGYRPDLLTGWGVRLHNWEISAQIQHELLTGMSVNVGYFRRWYGGFTTTDNLAVTPADYDHYCVTAPPDPRLPGGGGYQVCDLYDVTPLKFGQVQTQVVKSSVYGEQSENWRGIDATLNWRLPNGATVNGGVATGRTHTVNCAVVDLPARQYCDTLEPFLTQVKFLGFYPLPWWGLELSGVFQSAPGTELLAQQVYSSAQIKPLLGRDLSQGARGQVTVDLIQPRTKRFDRQNQIDLRVAKTIRYGRYRLTSGVQFFNLLNTSTASNLDPLLTATWPTPREVQEPRTAQVAVTLTF